MHKKRWITGLAALPFLVGLISWGGTALFAWVIAVVSVLGVTECFRLLFPGAAAQDGIMEHQPAPPGLSMQVLTGIVGLLIVYSAFKGATQWMTLLLALNLIASGAVAVTRFSGGTRVLETVFRQTAAVVYLPLFLSCLVFIRNGESGPAWIYFLLCVVFAGDIGAFYVGTHLGRHKLSPAISPGKTLEGAAGGLASNLVVGLAFRTLFLPELPLGLTAVFCLAAGLAAQLGDLFESMLKRAAGVKDSGGIFPGHGGLLDRIDALLFAAPVGFLFKEYLF